MVSARNIALKLGNDDAGFHDVAMILQARWMQKLDTSSICRRDRWPGVSLNGGKGCSSSGRGNVRK